MASQYPHTGSLNQPVKLQALTTNQSASSGAKIETWADYHSTFAAINYSGGNEAEQSATTIIKQKMVFTIRYKSGIIETMRLVYNSQNYDIELIEPIGRNRFLKLTCQLIKK